MLSVMMIILILAAVILILLVLLQPGKGDLSATFGGFSGQMGSMFGMQRTANLLAKTTKVLALVILVITLLTNMLFVGGVAQDENQRRVITEGQPINFGAPPGQLPEQPTTTPPQQ